LLIRNNAPPRDTETAYAERSGRYRWAAVRAQTSARSDRETLLMDGAQGGAPRVSPQVTTVDEVLRRMAREGLKRTGPAPALGTDGREKSPYAELPKPESGQTLQAVCRPDLKQPTACRMFVASGSHLLHVLRQLAFAKAVMTRPPCLGSHVIAGFFGARTYRVQNECHMDRGG